MNARTQPEALVLTATAEEIGEEQVCKDIGLFSAWLNSGLWEREPSSFAPISTDELIGQILLNPRATDEQLARAAKEIRQRYLRDEREEVKRRAFEAMTA